MIALLSVLILKSELSSANDALIRFTPRNKSLGTSNRPVIRRAHSGNIYRVMPMKPAFSALREKRD